MVSVITYLVAFATVFTFAATCAFYGYTSGFYNRRESYKFDWWFKAYEKAVNFNFIMQAVCNLLAVILMVLTTKRLQNLV